MVSLTDSYHPINTTVNEAVGEKVTVTDSGLVSIRVVPRTKEVKRDYPERFPKSIWYVVFRI